MPDPAPVIVPPAVKSSAPDKPQLTPAQEQANGIFTAVSRFVQSRIDKSQAEMLALMLELEKRVAELERR